MKFSKYRRGNILIEFPTGSPVDAFSRRRHDVIVKPESIESDPEIDSAKSNDSLGRNTSRALPLTRVSWGEKKMRKRVNKEREKEKGERERRKKGHGAADELPANKARNFAAGPRGRREFTARRRRVLSAGIN